MKKVVIFENYPAPYRIDLYNILAREFDLTVCYGVKNDKTRNKNYVNSSCGFKTVYLKGLRYGETGCFSFGFKKLLKQKFDCVIVGGYSSGYPMLLINYLKRKKIPYILNADGGFITEHESRLKKNVKTHFIAGANMYLASGEFTKKYLEYYGAKAENIRFYPFAFNFAAERCFTEVSEKLCIRERLKITEEKIILAIGRLVDFKRFKLMMKAYSALDKNIGIYLVGGKPSQDYEDLKVKLNLSNLHFVDFKDKNSLSEYYKMADIFVLPSDGEVWGLVINEALFHGLPVLTTTKCGAGLTLINDDENGFLVTPNDESLLLEQTERILGDAALMDRLSRKAYDSVAEFNIEANAAAHCKVINEFCLKF